MLGLTAVVIAFLSAGFVAMSVLREGSREQTAMVFASMGMPPAIYVLLAYILGMNTIPEPYLGISLLFFSLGVLGVNVGRVAIEPIIVRIIEKSPDDRGIGMVLNAFLETGAIFLLLLYILGYMAFSQNDWSGIPHSPDAFGIGMEIMGIAVFIGSVLIGYVIKMHLEKILSDEVKFRDEFKKISLHVGFAQTILILGFMLSLLTYLGSFSI